MSATATSSTPGTFRAVRVSPWPMLPAPRQAMRIRSLGETGVASCSAWTAAERANTVVAPAVALAIFRNCRRVG